jgi:hypothetical protein
MQPHKTYMAPFQVSAHRFARRVHHCKCKHLESLLPSVNRRRPLHSRVEKLKLPHGTISIAIDTYSKHTWRRTHLNVSLQNTRLNGSVTDKYMRANPVRAKQTHKQHTIIITNTICGRGTLNQPIDLALLPLPPSSSTKHCLPSM